MFDMKRILAFLTVIVMFGAPSCGTPDDDDSFDEGEQETSNSQEENGDGDPSQDDNGTSQDEPNGEDPEDESPQVCTDHATDFPLQEGDCVPDFTLPAQDGATMITLSDYAGEYVLLSSFPLADTPVCTGQMQKLDEMYDEFIAEGIQPFGFNNEPPEAKRDWHASMGIENLLILADNDPLNEVSDMFGISGMYTQRANTVIGPDGRFVMTQPVTGAADIPAILDEIRALEE